MRTVEQTLGLWVTGLLSSEEVVDWAGREIARLEHPAMELFDLASDGPEACLKRAEIDFPYRPARPTYSQAFAFKATNVILASDESVLSFAHWAARSCIGENQADPFVPLGYLLDHYIDDCQDKNGAIALLRTELPSLLPLCESLAMPYVESDALYLPEDQK